MLETTNVLQIFLLKTIQQQLFSYQKSFQLISFH